MELEDVVENSDIRLTMAPTANPSTFSIEWKLWLPLAEGENTRTAYTNCNLSPVLKTKYVFDDADTEDGLDALFENYVENFLLAISTWTHVKGYCTTIIEYLAGSVIANTESEYNRQPEKTFGAFSVLFAMCGTRLLQAMSMDNLSVLDDDLAEMVEFHYRICGGDLSDI